MSNAQPSSPKPTLQWWYLSREDTAQGPYTTSQILSLFHDGQIDGLTKLSSDASTLRSSWLPLSEHTLIRDAARKLASSIDEGSEGNEIASDDGTANHEQVQVDNEAPKGKRSSNGENARIANDDSNGQQTPVGHETSGGEQAPIDDEGSNGQQTGPSARPEDNVVSSKQSSRRDETPAEQAARRERKRQSRKRGRELKRLRELSNTSVYITGLPADTTVEEVAKHFGKCGIILPYAESGMPRVKVYKDENGRCKGDGLVTYARAESVENALEILDGAELREGHGLKVERATFEHKGGERRETKRRKGYGSRAMVEEMLGWEEEGGRGGRIVILKNVFEVDKVDCEVVEEDMKEGCGECGDVEKVTVFEGNVEGVVAVKFQKWEECVECVKVMNGRWYDGRKLTAMIYDGVTDYRYKESEEERKQRERKWQEWLEGDE